MPLRTATFMMKKLPGFISAIFVSAIILLSFPSVSFAQTAPPCDGQVTDFGCLPADPLKFVEQIYTWGLMLIGSVAVLFLIIGGYYIMTSRGNTQQLERGKSFIFYSLAGVFLGVLGFVFIEIVTGQILKIPGFS